MPALIDACEALRVAQIDVLGAVLADAPQPPAAGPKHFVTTPSASAPDGA